MSLKNYFVRLFQAENLPTVQIIQSYFVTRYQCLLSIKHSINLQCDISKISVIREEDGTTGVRKINDTELECPECEVITVIKVQHSAII